MHDKSQQLIQERINHLFKSGWVSALSAKNHEWIEWILDQSSEPANLDKSWASSAVRLCAETKDLRPIELLLASNVSATQKGNDGFSGMSEAAFLAWPKALDLMERSLGEKQSKEQLSELLLFALAGASLSVAWERSLHIHGSKEAWADKLDGPGPRAKRLALLEKLLADGADPNAVGPLGCSPLALASASGQPALVQVLLSAGADTNLLSMGTAAWEFTLMAELPFSGAGIDRKACQRLLGAPANISTRQKRITPKDAELLAWIKGTCVPGASNTASNASESRMPGELDFGSFKRSKGAGSLPRALSVAFKTENWQGARFATDAKDEAFSYSWTQYDYADNYAETSCSVGVAVATVEKPGGDFKQGDKVLRVGYAEGSWVRWADFSRKQISKFPQGDTMESLSGLTTSACRPSDGGREAVEYLGSVLLLARQAWGGLDWALSPEKQENEALAKAIKLKGPSTARLRI